MEKRCTWDNGSLWLKGRPCKIYVGQWPIFHGPLILPYIIVRLKLFLYIKKWHWPGVFVPLRALALVGHEVKVSMTYISWSSDFALYPYILKTIWCMYIILSEYETVRPGVWPQNKCRSLWPIFHGPVIVPYTLKTISCMNIIIWDYESVWPDAWAQNKCRLPWPICHGPVILPYILKATWCIYIILSVYDLKINVCLCDPYFMVQWLCLIPWRLFHVWTSLFGIMNQYDPTHDLKLNVGHHDLYFIGQCFYVICWRLFDVWTSSLGIMGQYDQTFDLKINICHCDLYFMVHWFCLISQRLSDGWVSYF